MQNVSRKKEKGLEEGLEEFKNLNCQIPKQDHKDLKKIAKALGGMSLSALVRQNIEPGLKRYRETGDPKQFLED